MRRLEALLARTPGNKLLVRAVNVYDGVRRVRGKEYIQSIITVPAEVRGTLFKRTGRFLAYVVLVDGKPALLLEPAAPPTEEDVEEFIEALEGEKK
ncbi:hypothetical protein [Thermofilum sp.]|jgi:hypothetical protein|uniref:hypothetical protein n=1 Tax=Thermofilum sp. TaxID=1961369 RepID=UPI00258C3CF2|nr:hypothetical protein [Thermofilum sp.]